jgi:hypothetical protein
VKFPFHVIELLKRESGSGLRLPSDCERSKITLEYSIKMRKNLAERRKSCTFAAAFDEAPAGDDGGVVLLKDV